MDVVQLTEADETAALLVRIFEVNDRAMVLLNSSLAVEIERTRKEF